MKVIENCKKPLALPFKDIPHGMLFVATVDGSNIIAIKSNRGGMCKYEPIVVSLGSINSDFFTAGWAWAESEFQAHVEFIKYCENPTFTYEG